MPDIVHTSVLAEEVCEYLAPTKALELFIDSTMGEGGHSWLMLSRFEDLRVIGLDADTKIQEVARKRLSKFEDRVRFFNTWFNDFYAHYPLGDERPDKILFDLGISMFHYVSSGRGFTFLKDEELDMRLNPQEGESAGDIVNHWSEEDLRNLFFTYGEEKFSRQIARLIVKKRKEARIESTQVLADIVKGAVPAKQRHGRIHPATRVFQALRIEANKELDRLKQVLEDSLRVLKVGGRLGVITFHSLEDRIVKHFFKEMNKSCICPPEWPICKCRGYKIVDILTRKPVAPTEEEIAHNAASRSSKLRVIEKVNEVEEK